MSGSSSRKPSGSSTHSGAHSPSGSPGTTQSHRKLNPSTAGNMYGVGMGASNGLKPLSSGWQVWGASPSSKRNASVSSATSVNELSSSGDASFRGHMGDWSASRPTSGTWDDIADIPQKMDFPQMDPHSSMPLHTRQRQSTVTQAPTFPAPRIDDRSAGSKTGQFSPQRYENPLGKDSNGSRYTLAASPTRPFGTAYPGQPNVIQNSSFDNLPTSATDELSLALRGMVVEDDYSARQQAASSHSSGPHPNNRAQPMPPPRPYNSYPQGEYNPYYSIPPGRESYGEYPYGYEAYRGPADPSFYASSNMNPSSPANLYPGVSPGLHPNAVVEMHRQQPGLFFDFNAAARPPASQFYYPAHQGVMYPPAHSPMVTPQLGRTNPISIADKKREMQYNLQQQLSPQNVMYGSMRSTPSPHPQPFGGAADYGSPISVMMSGGPMFPQPMHVYPRGLRQSRRNDWNEPTALRSALLDEFRANKARKWELRDIFGYIVEFSGDQHGSRFIQQKLENATSEEKQIVFDEIVPDNTLQLIQDVFGNYVIQKLFEHGTQVQKTLLASTMEGHVLPLSLQMYGCRVVQKAVEYILPDQQGTFVKELDVHVLKCVKDANGNHVIQKLIERVSPDRLGFVTSFRGNVYDLSTHPYGCRVLQRCLEHLPDEHTRPLLEELHKYTVNLMQDQFGNYVVQFVLENGKPQDKGVIISKLRGQMLQMARHKFASNVCEKALVCADPETRRVLIDEMMTPKHDGVSPIVTMMKDQYANYVLQRALAVVEGDQKEALIGRVKPQLVNMRRYSSAYSKHLVSIERLLEKYTGVTPSEPGLDLPSLNPETP